MVFCMLVIPVGEFEYLITVISSLAYFETLPYILSVVSRPVVLSPNVVALYQSHFLTVLWPPYVIGGTLYFCPLVSFYLLSSSSSFFSSPNLSGHRLDVYHTSTHGMALVRI